MQESRAKIEFKSIASLFPASHEQESGQRQLAPDKNQQTSRGAGLRSLLGLQIDDEFGSVLGLSLVVIYRGWGKEI